MYIRTLDPDYHAEQAALEERDTAEAERRADYWTESADRVRDLIDAVDSSALFDGTVTVKIHSRQLPLGDAAIIAAFLPTDQRDSALDDIRRAFYQWIIDREMEA